MKGVLLAGGSGSRLLPLTKCQNKHLLPVGRVPMIMHPLRTLQSAGIEEIVVVTGVEHIGSIVNFLESGSHLGCNLTYKIQDKPGGIAQALALAETSCKNDKLAVILGDNIFEDDMAPMAQEFEDTEGAMIALKTVADPSRYGVADIRRDERSYTKRIVRIIEKPKDPPSLYAVTGLYMYDPDVFDVIRTIKPSERGELEITDVNNHYIQQKKLKFRVLKGFWSDAGTFDSLGDATSWALSR